MDAKQHYPDINQRIQMKLLNRATNEIFSSRVEDIQEKGLLVVAPMSNMKPIFLPKRTEVVVRYHDDNAFYEMISEVLESRRTTPRMVLLAHTDRVYRIQRRKYFRIEVFLPVAFERKDGYTSKGYAKDISGGGLLLKIANDEGVVVGDEVRVGFDLSGRRIDCWGELVRRKRDEEEREDYCLFGLEFTEITYEDRRAIIRWCFNEQLRRASKG